MIIKPSNSASRRTHNRIAEHGRHGFTVSGRGDFNGVAAWLMRSRATKWLGWLPADEFEELAR